MKNVVSNLSKIFTSLVVSAFFMGCAAQLSDKIDVPEIPNVTKVSSAKNIVNTGTVISVEDFIDTRLGQIAESDSDSKTQPDGLAIGGTVRDAVVKALENAGITVSPDAPLALTGEIKRWDAKTAAAVTSSIESNASIRINVVDKAGKNLYTGNYSGERASQFPVVSEPDVKDSLGLAMSGAIEQAINDKDLLKAISR